MDSAVIIKILVAIVYGVALGVVTIPLSKKLTLSRTDDPAKASPLNKASLKIITVVFGIAASAAIVFTADATDLLVRNLLLLIPIFSISVVDALVRKIPNPLLLVMLIIEAVYVIYHCVSTKSSDIFIKILVGFLVGMIVCFLPSLLKIPMGAGDIKYSAVIGICIFAMGYFQSMIFMGILIAIYLVYLKITKKGGLKTLVPMGPFLSAGTVISMCFLFTDFIHLGQNIL
jgi:prepilin signal peptidase PulO-like enzyme (type II secretory pathway)